MVVTRRARRLFVLTALLTCAALIISSSLAASPDTLLFIAFSSAPPPPPSPPPSPSPTPSASPSPTPPPLLPPPFCEGVPPHCGLNNTCAAAPPPFAPLDPAAVRIDAEGGCSWARLSGFANLSLCTHSAHREMVSKLVHDRGSWLTPEELAAFKEVACTRERPVMFDVGSNIGSFAVPAAALGCHVIAFDPVPANLGRVAESMRRAGNLGNATLLRNFVGSAHTHRRVQGENVDNMGGMSFLREEAREGEAESVAFVVLDELFGWAGRPLSPRTGQPLQPGEVNFIKIDAEGCDLEVLYGAQTLLQRNPVPFITIEFAGNGNCMRKCSGERFVQFVYGLGYSFYEPYKVDSAPIPLAQAPESGELWLVHKSAARMPTGWSRAA